MKIRVLLAASTALAATMAASGAFAQAEPAPPTSAAPATTSQPAERLGASGGPVLQNAAPDSAAARQSAQNGTNVTTNPQAANVAGSTGIAEVVVTAEKRSQSLQRVPAAVTAFTSEKRDLIGIISVVDQTNYTPGLTYTQGNDRLSLRGVGRLTNAHTADSGTAIYSDGVFTTSTTEAGKSPMLVERTEILRGPQGTLYGRNAIGGAYNVISKRPSKEFGGEARVSVGNYDSHRFDAVVSAPINEHLRTKFAFSENYVGEGFAHNFVPGLPTEAGNRDEQYMEAQIEGEVGKLDFWALYSKSIWTNSAPPGTSVGGSFAPGNPTYGTGTFPSATYAYGDAAARGLPAAFNVVYRGPYLGNSVLLSGDLTGFQRDIPFKNTLHGTDTFRTHLTYHMPNFDIKYVGGFLRYDYKYVADTDGTAIQSYQVPLTAGGTCARLALAGACGPATVYFGNYNTYEEDEEFYSHEVTIASTWDSPLQYIAGAYLYHEKFQYPQDVYAPNQPQIKTPLLTDGKTPAVANPKGEYAHTNNFASVVSKAIYGQIDYKFLTDFKVTAGVRYTQDDKKTTEEERFIAYGGSGAPTLGSLGTLAPAIDITSAITGTIPAALRALGITQQQGLVVAPYYDPVTGNWRRGLRDGSNAVTGTFGVEWTPTRRTLAYAKYSRGYKAFGFNTAVASAFSPFPYSAPEGMDAFEVGLKRDWTRRLQTNITGFYDMYYNAQVPLTVQQGQVPAYSIFYNVPRSIIQGIEMETIWQPIDHLNVLFTYAYLDSHVSKACCLSDGNDPTAVLPGAKPVAGSSQGAIDPITLQPARGQDLAGNQLPLSPKHKIAINLNYTYAVGSYGDLIGSISYLWRGEQYSSFFNRAYSYIPSRDQVDGRVTFRDAKNRYSVIGYVRNLFNNQDYETLGGTRTTLGALYQTYTLVDPRTYGVELQYRF